MGEALDQAAAAGLVVGVGDLAAVDDRAGLDRELLAELGVAVVEGRRGGDHLEGRARGLERGERLPREGEDVAVLGVEDGGAAEGAAEGGDGRVLQVGVDRRPHGLAGNRRLLGDQRLAVVAGGEELAAGRSGEDRVERELESGLAARGALGEAGRGHLLRAARRGACPSRR